MQIVIEIPDTAYEGIKKAATAGGDWGQDLLGVLCKGVNDGRPLPKGHGRLIDADALEDTLGCSDRDIYAKACIREDAPTILEADKGDKECEK